MEPSLGLVVGWEGRFGSWRCWKSGVEREDVPRIGWGRNDPKEPRVLLSGEKGGETDFTGVLKP